MKNKCPICGCSFEANAQITVLPCIKLIDNDENMLREALLKYWQWIAEGQKKYGYTNREQLFYDNYHNYIKYIPEEDVYSFSIQIYDSPSGDTWLRGKFKLEGRKIKILEKKHNYC